MATQPMQNEQSTKAKDQKLLNEASDLDKEQNLRNEVKSEVSEANVAWEANSLNGYERFIKWLHRPVDGCTLGVFRMLYGLAMLIDIAEERGGSQLSERFGEQKCHFPLIEGIRAFSLPVMSAIYLCQWLGALGITLGYRFHLSCLAFIVPYWYIFLLDKPAWNNHSYLFGLVGTMLLFTRANSYCSLDSLCKRSVPAQVPYWNYFIIKFQFFILYLYAGLKKLSIEWLSGYAMSSLSRHWVLSPFLWVLGAEMTDLLIVHWFTAIFDFSIAFLMTWKRTRLWATPFMLSFHLMNSRLFVIGMFPWVCLAQVPMFFGFAWPRKLQSLHFRELFKASKCHNPMEQKENANLSLTTANKTMKSSPPKAKDKRLYCKGCQKALCNVPKSPLAHYMRTLLILCYCALQLFLPYSHFITQGYNNWTNGLYGYSWDMMMHSYDTVLVKIRLLDNSSNETYFLNPYAFTNYDRWTKAADMAKQYALCIRNEVLRQHQADPASSPLKSRNLSIYFDVWCSMNGRFQQRVFDPRVDLLTAAWSPFKRTSWSLPLLTELNHMRPKLRSITDEVLAWSNYSDVLFVADFPGLTLENFISADLRNVSLTILEGNVRYQNDAENESYLLTAGKSISIPNGIMHSVTTIGLKPSCYLYTYINQTMEQSGAVLDAEDADKRQKPLLPLWAELKARMDNYGIFLQNMKNTIMYFVYDVPMESSQQPKQQSKL